MVIEIREIATKEMALYDAIPNHVSVETVLRVESVGAGLAGFRLVEHRLAEPYIKDYCAPGDDRPSAWGASFDPSRWGLFLAGDGQRAVGGAAVTIDAAVYPLDCFQREDLSVLWDIRVHPEYRGRGIGTALFRRAAEWARDRGCGQLGIETQNVNLPACRFYVMQGCVLGAIHRLGYAGLPAVAHEAMLLWYLDL